MKVITAMVLISSLLWIVEFCKSPAKIVRKQGCRQMKSMFYIEKLKFKRVWPIFYSAERILPILFQGLTYHKILKNEYSIIFLSKNENIEACLCITIKTSLCWNKIKGGLFLTLNSFFVHYRKGASPARVTWKKETLAPC